MRIKNEPIPLPEYWTDLFALHYWKHNYTVLWDKRDIEDIHRTIELWMKATFNHPIKFGR